MSKVASPRIWKFNKNAHKKMSEMTDEELQKAKSHCNSRINYYYGLVEFFSFKESQLDEEIELRNQKQKNEQTAESSGELV